MNTRTKKILTTILAIAICLAGTYFLLHSTNPEGYKHQNSILGLLIGLVLIGAYQQAMPFAWVYFSRLFLNALALGAGCMLWNAPDWIIFGIGAHPGRDLLLEVAMGFIFGLFIGLFDVFRYLNIARQTQYAGPEHPIITSFATRSFSGKTSSRGRALLMRDRFLFLSPRSAQVEYLFRDILEIRIVKHLGFPSHLTFVFNGAESATFMLAMPGYWKKRVEEAKDPSRA